MIRVNGRNAIPDPTTDECPAAAHRDVRKAAVHYIERMHRLALNQARSSDEPAYVAQDAWLEPELDPRTLALVRLAALVAVGGEVPSYGAHADAAVDAGASAAEVVDVLVAVLPVVGLPRVVAAAPRLALALGYDLDALERESAG